MLVVGKTLKVHGLKGELKTQSFLDSPDLFNKIKSVVIKNKRYSVEKARQNGEFVLLKLASVDTVDAAKELCGLEVQAEKEQLPTLPDGRFYISDLIGCIVMAEKERVGKIKEVLQYGAADVLVLTKEGKTIMLPWVKNLFDSVDIDRKLKKKKKKTVDEVAVYED